MAAKVIIGSGCAGEPRPTLGISSLHFETWLGSVRTDVPPQSIGVAKFVSKICPLVLTSWNGDPKVWIGRVSCNRREEGATPNEQRNVGERNFCPSLFSFRLADDESASNEVG